MSILKFINDRNDKPEQLEQKINYILRPSVNFITGWGINPQFAYNEMLLAKKMFHQEHGKQYLHVVVSCDKYIKEEYMVHDIALRTAYFYKDYQILIAVHNDRPNLHAHLIINSVNMITGNKLSQRNKDFWAVRKYVEEIFICYGLAKLKKDDEEINGEELQYLDPDEYEELRKSKSSPIVYFPTPENFYPV